MGHIVLFVFLSLVLSSAVRVKGEGFDWRHHEEHGNIVSATRNYMGLRHRKSSQLGAIFAVTAMIADRLAIFQPLKPKVQLSNQVLSNCLDAEVFGSIEQILQYILHNRGVPDRTCMGFRGRKEQCTPRNTCVNCYMFRCKAKASYLKYPITKYQSIDSSVLKDEIKEHGPVACIFNDLSFGELVGFTDDGHFNAKRDLGVFHGNEGYDAITREHIKQCWGVTIDEPYRYVDHGLAEILRFESLWEIQSTKFEGSLSNERGTTNSKSRHQSLRHIPISNLPTNFSWMNRNTLTPVQSHHNGPGYCGACWSMAAASTFSDRLKIHSTGSASMDVFVSPQSIIDCVKGNRSHGCFGGDSADVWPYYNKVGTVDETCNLWVSKHQHCSSQEPSCKYCDANGKCKAVPKENFTTYHSQSWGTVHGEEKMMNEIYQGGPIDCMIATPHAFSEDFTGDGIICDHESKPSQWHISHDISIVGWGETERGEKYWLLRNSWGTRFGDNGFAKVCRGLNKPKGNMLIESSCTWVLPTVNSKQLPLSDLS